MGMSTRIVGIRPPDETWKHMKAVYDACQVAGVEIPPEVDNFFDGERPGKDGMVVELYTAVSEHDDGSRMHYDVRLADLPAGVTIVRFTNSW